MVVIVMLKSSCIKQGYIVTSGHQRYQQSSFPQNQINIKWTSASRQTNHHHASYIISYYNNVNKGIIMDKDSGNIPHCDHMKYVLIWFNFETEVDSDAPMHSMR